MSQSLNQVSFFFGLKHHLVCVQNSRLALKKKTLLAVPTDINKPQAAHVRHEVGRTCMPAFSFRTSEGRESRSREGKHKLRGKSINGRSREFYVQI